LGKKLEAAGYTGSRSEQEKIKSQQKSLEEGWNALDERRAQREERARSEEAELTSISERLKDLEKLEEDDRDGSREGGHEERMRVLRGLADNLSGQFEGRSENRPELDMRPPPYPHPPGHGRPATGERDHEEAEESKRARSASWSAGGGGSRKTDERLYYNGGEERREAERNERHRDERWSQFRRLHRDSVARGAFGGAGRVGDGVHVVRAEERGEMISAADMVHMALPAVFPSDLRRG